MDKDMQWVCNALALAGKTMELLGRGEKICPFKLQSEPRGWTASECQTCDYSHEIRAREGAAVAVLYKAEVRATCWIEYFLWAARQDVA